MTDFSDVEAMRPKLAILCRLPKGRTNPPDIEMAHNWHPYTVTDPASRSYYTDSGAWEVIADTLDEGAPITYKQPTEEHPDHCYVILTDRKYDGRSLYLKISIPQPFSKLMGISFHYERYS